MNWQATTQQPFPCILVKKKQHSDVGTMQMPYVDRGMYHHGGEEGFDHNSKVVNTAYILTVLPF